MNSFSTINVPQGFIAQSYTYPQQLGKMGITVSLGWYQKLTVNQLTTAISDLLSAQQKRQQMSEKGRQLVDGLGNQRVIEKMR